MKTLIIISTLLLTSCVHTQPQYVPQAPIPSPHYDYKPQSNQGYHVAPSGRYEGYQGGYDITPVP